MGAVYTQISLQERRRIEDMLHAKAPVAQIARHLCRHRSSIYREIKLTATPASSWAGEPIKKIVENYHEDTECFALFGFQGFAWLHDHERARGLSRHLTFTSSRRSPSL